MWSSNVNQKLKHYCLNNNFYSLLRELELEEIYEVDDNSNIFDFDFFTLLAFEVKHNGHIVINNESHRQAVLRGLALIEPTPGEMVCFSDNDWLFLRACAERDAITEFNADERSWFFANIPYIHSTNTVRFWEFDEAVEYVIGNHILHKLGLLTFLEDVLTEKNQVIQYLDQIRMTMKNWECKDQIDVHLYLNKSIYELNDFAFMEDEGYEVVYYEKCEELLKAADRYKNLLYSAICPWYSDDYQNEYVVTFENKEEIGKTFSIKVIENDIIDIYTYDDQDVTKQMLEYVKKMAKINEYRIYMV